MRHILIAEDEDFLQRALKDNLESEGFLVSTSSNGQECLAQIKKKKPDLLVLDLLMPKMDGFAVLKELKNDPVEKFIPVIVLSNLGGESEIKRAMDLGANDYFVKSQHPIEEVVEKIHESIERGRPARMADEEDKEKKTVKKVHKTSKK